MNVRKKIVVFIALVFDPEHEFSALHQQTN
jgi:hypothetical protein